MPEDFWDKFIEEKRQRMEKEEKEKNERLERARREEKSWELARICKSEIEEMKKDSWFRNKEVRKEQERLEREKRDRFRVIGEKKKNQGNKQNLKVKQVTRQR